VNTTGGYLAMLMGAAGAIIPFFFLHWSENVTGFAAFGLAATGLVVGSLVGPSGPEQTGPLKSCFGDTEDTMRYWQWFWTVSLVIAGTSFAAITVVVTLRGFCRFA